MFHYFYVFFVWTDDSKLGVISGKSTDKPNQNRFDIPLTTASSTTQTKQEVDPSKPGIKIKEITKPEEIRITDDKPKIYKQAKTQTSINKESTTSGPPFAVTASSFESTATTTTTAKFIDESTTVLLNEKDESSTEENVKSESSEITTRDYSKNMVESSTVNSIESSNEKHDIDLTTEFSSTTSTQSSNDVTTLNVLEINLKGEENNASIDVSTTKGPEITSELSINVVVEHSGRNQSITVVGAAGLQRGDDPENGSTTIEPPLPSSPPQSLNPNTELLSVKNKTVHINPIEKEKPFVDEFSSINNSTDSLERNETTNSMEIIRLNEDSSEGNNDDALNTTASTKNPFDEEIYDTVYHGSETNSTDETNTSSTTVQPNDDELDVERDINPEFPHIPDDLSIHSAHMTEDALHEKRPISEKLILSSTVNIFDEDLHLVSTSTQQSASDIDIELPIEERSPGEPHLIPEWERNNNTNENDESNSQEEFDNNILSKKHINGGDYSTESASIETESDGTIDDETVGSGGSSDIEFKSNIMEIIGIQEPPQYSVHLSNVYDWFRS